MTLTQGEGLEGQLQQTPEAGITCPSCGTKFTYEKGAQEVKRLGIQAKITVCPYCFSAYPLDETSGQVQLGEEVASRYPAVVREKSRVRLTTCEVCHQKRKEGSFTCDRCGHVNWTSLIFLATFGVVAIGVGFIAKQYLSLAGWVLGAIILGTCIIEVNKAIRTPKTYKNIQ